VSTDYRTNSLVQWEVPVQIYENPSINMNKPLLRELPPLSVEGITLSKILILPPINNVLMSPSLSNATILRKNSSHAPVSSLISSFHSISQYDNIQNSETSSEPGMSSQRYSLDEIESFGGEEEGTVSSCAHSDYETASYCGESGRRKHGSDKLSSLDERGDLYDRLRFPGTQK
jgi:hypothetical protein